MRKLPVDTNRLELVFTGSVTPAPVYVEQADGSTKRDPDQQARTADGIPVWLVDVVPDQADGNGGRNSETVAVKVASRTEPQPTKWRPVEFEGLVASIYRDRAGYPQVSLSATGIASTSVKAAS